MEELKVDEFGDLIVSHEMQANENNSNLQKILHSKKIKRG